MEAAADEARAWCLRSLRRGPNELARVDALLSRFSAGARNSPFRRSLRGPHRAVMWKPEGPPKIRNLNARGKYCEDGIDGRDQLVEPHLAAVAIEHCGFPTALHAACVQISHAGALPLGLALLCLNLGILPRLLAARLNLRLPPPLLTEDPLDAVPRKCHAALSKMTSSAVRWPGDTATCRRTSSQRAHYTHDRSALPIKPGHDEARRS